MSRVTPIPPHRSLKPRVKWKDLHPGQACILSESPMYVYLKLGHTRASLAFDAKSGQVGMLESENIEKYMMVIPIKTDIHFDLSDIYKEVP